MKFDEGKLPSDKLVSDWLKVVDEFFDSPNASKSEHPNKVIAVHCISGLSRAPLLVAMALAHKGMQTQIAVKVIREGKKGAITYN